MKEAKHTPGPWVVDVTPNQYVDGAHWREVRIAPQGTVLTEVFHDLGDPDPSISDEEAAANAQLIAAAPDLLEACEAYEARIGDSDMGSEYLTSLVLAALAKARGEA